MYLFANFKAYLDFDETNILVHQLLASDALASSPAQIALFPSDLTLSEVQKATDGTRIGVGGQHLSAIDGDAATGAFSAAQLASVGVQYVLVGHSERRHLMGETDSMVAAQFTAAVKAGLTAVLCIGETLSELEQGSAKERIRAQLACVDGVSSDAYMVAYEPVWAITGSGSGQSCDPAAAEAMHMYIRSIVGETVPVLYGGSVNAENVVSYTSLPSVDGVLVGSASTTLDRFISMLKALA